MVCLACPLWAQLHGGTPDLDRHSAKLSRVSLVGCRLETDTVAMFDALTVQLCDVERFGDGASGLGIHMSWPFQNVTVPCCGSSSLVTFHFSV